MSKSALNRSHPMRRITLLGIVLLVAGLAVVVGVARLTVVTCTGTANNRATCTIERYRLPTGASQHYERISRAEVRCVYTDAEAPCTNTLTLYRDRAPTVTRTDFTPDQQIIVADVVNDLIASPTANETSAYFPELRVLALRLVPALVLFVGGAVLVLRGRAAPRNGGE